MLLPSQMIYHICSYEENSSGFFSCIRLPLHTKEEVTKWKDNFQESSLTTWRVARTHPNERKSVLYRVSLFKNFEASNILSLSILFIIFIYLFITMNV